MTNDEVVARQSFVTYATSLLSVYGRLVALHVRAKNMNARAMLALTMRLTDASHDSGALVIVNDRADVALAGAAAGVHLSARSLSMEGVRAIDGATRLVLGYSAHSAAEADQACANGADYVFLGTIWPSASHPGEEGAGVELIRETRPRVSCPLIAIGGVTPARSQEALAAGAHGVAVIAGVWNAAEPVAAAGNYLEAMQVVA